MMDNSLQHIYASYQKRISELSKALIDYEYQKFSIQETIQVILEELLRLKKESESVDVYDEIFQTKLNRFILLMKGELKQSKYNSENFGTLHDNLRKLVESLDYDYCLKKQKNSEKKTFTKSASEIAKKNRKANTAKYLMVKNGTIHYIIPYQKLIKASKVICKKRAKIKINNVIYNFQSLPGLLEDEIKMRTGALLMLDSDKTHGILFDKIERILYMKPESIKKKMKYLKSDRRFMDYFPYKGVKYYYYSLSEKI